ncbi:killer cell lectin-like receptor subfamily G member 1 [Eleutherodactylus coqui]|uniref:killer cell lectin-like receptor subfamily G member 1 n=1 Tax=Eleutherodactylus coqui TaxID=57060 RepID=UPI003462577A
MVDFPENFTEISVNSSVVVSCQQGYREKNITLQCREESGQFLLSPADGDHCTGSGDSSKSGYILGPSSTAASSSPCPDPWILITNKCYLFSENKKTRRASEEDCEKRGSRLATVKEGTILKLVAITEQEFWIGLEALGSHHRGGWSGRWADGSTVNVTEETGTCAKIKSKLSLHNCMEELHWICERDVTAP